MTALAMQRVVVTRDGRYLVRTFELGDDGWAVVREALADARSIAQATLAGHVIYED